MQKYLNFFKSPERVFTLVLGASLLFWLGWFFIVAFKPVSTVEEVQEAKPLVSADPKAYKTTESYLDKISAYQLPDFSKLYTITEPFREYSKSAPTLLEP